MLLRLLILSILLLANSSQALAQYQSLTLKPQKVNDKPFKLNVEESTAKFTPSNIGIVGMKYLHKPGSMSTVVEIYPNTPAQRAGIVAGDRLLAVNSTNVMPLDSNEVFGLISGLPGVPIKLQFMRCNYYGNNCYTFNKELIRMDMNELKSDNVYRIYKYGG